MGEKKKHGVVWWLLIGWWWRPLVFLSKVFDDGKKNNPIEPNKI